MVVLPAGAILGARALVPRRITGRLTALAAAGVATVAALLPLSWAAAARAPQIPAYAVLTTWLEEHGLHYGLGGYWDGSSVTLQSGGAVQVRTVHLVDGAIRPFPWETNTLWYDPARHYANFVVIDLVNIDLVPRSGALLRQAGQQPRCRPMGSPHLQPQRPAGGQAAQAHARQLATRRHPLTPSVSHR